MSVGMLLFWLFIGGPIVCSIIAGVFGLLGAVFGGRK